MTPTMFCTKKISSSFLWGDQPMFMKNAEERLLLLLNFHCIGRGGEPKFLLWTGPTGARWGGKLGCLVLLWREVKNINSYWLTVIANAFSNKGCTLRELAVFAAAGGLGRLDLSKPPIVTQCSLGSNT